MVVLPALLWYRNKPMYSCPGHIVVVHMPGGRNILTGFKLIFSTLLQCSQVCTICQELCQLHSALISIIKGAKFATGLVTHSNPYQKAVEWMIVMVHMPGGRNILTGF
ncbi:hypothetical protein XENTR_v10007126 [Xenopus tropicalis]|nr:hypothetical protein XENTR_v10007126 [Xenopus tropicalis]